MILRRALLIGGAGVLVTGAIAASPFGRNLFYSVLTEPVTGRQIDVATAHELVQAGEITLVDIRRPDEWAASGSPEGAVQLDMLRDDFVQELTRIAGGDPDAAIALICARGVRSARLANQLVEAGFTNIIDVPEGMLGSAAGPGWVRAGLPVVRN